MNTKRSAKAAVLVFGFMALVAAAAAPASAASSPYNVEAQRMRISVGSTNFDTPGSTPATCIGSTAIAGTIDDTAGTINGSINISSSDFAAPFTSGRYRLTATGTSGTGTYNAGTGTFSGLAFSTITFSIRSINTSTCAVGSTVCSGTATLTASGGLVSGSTVPLSTGEQVYVNGTGSISTTSGCGFPWGLVVSPGASLTIAKNPSTPSDAGAVFQQL